MKNLYNRNYSIVEGLQYYIYLTTNLHIRKLGSSFIKSDLDNIIIDNSKVQSNHIFNLYQNFSGVDSNTTISQLGDIIGRGRYYNNNSVYLTLSKQIPTGETCILYDKFEQQSYNITFYTPNATNSLIVISEDISNLTFSPNRFQIRYGTTTNYVLYQSNQIGLDINYFMDSEKELVSIFLDEFSEYSTEGFTNATNILLNYSGYTFYTPILNIDTTNITNYNILLNIYNIIEYYNFIKMLYSGLRDKIELSLLDISRNSINNVIDYDDDDKCEIPHFNFNTKLFKSSYTDWKNFLIFKFKQITFLYEFYKRESELLIEYFNLAIYDGMRDVTNAEYLNSIEIINDNSEPNFIYSKILKNTSQSNYTFTTSDHLLSYNTYQLYDRIIVPFQNNNLTILDNNNSISLKLGLFKDHMKWMINSTSNPNYTSTQLLNLLIESNLSLYFVYNSVNILDLRGTNIFQKVIQQKYYNKFQIVVTTTGLPSKYIMRCSDSDNLYYSSLIDVSSLSSNYNINFNMTEEILKLVRGMNEKTISQYETFCINNLHYLLNLLFNQYDDDLVSKITQNVLPTSYSGGQYVYQFIDAMRLYELIQSYLIKLNHKKYTNFDSNFNNFKLDNINNYNFIELFTGYFKNGKTYLGLNSIINYINNNDSIYQMLSSSMIFLLNSSHLSYNETILNTETTILREECLNNFQANNTKSIISVRENVMDIVKQIIVEQ